MFLSPSSARAGVLFLSFRSCMSPLYLHDENQDENYDEKWSDFLICTYTCTASLMHTHTHTCMYLGLCLCSARYILAHRWMITAFSARYCIFLATAVHRHRCNQGLLDPKPLSPGSEYYDTLLRRTYISAQRWLRRWPSSTSYRPAIDSPSPREREGYRDHYAWSGQIQQTKEKRKEKFFMKFLHTFRLLPFQLWRRLWSFQTWSHRVPFPRHGTEPHWTAEAQGGPASQEESLYTYTQVVHKSNVL